MSQIQLSISLSISVDSSCRNVGLNLGVVGEVEGLQNVEHKVAVSKTAVTSGIDSSSCLGRISLEVELGLVSESVLRSSGEVEQKSKSGGAGALSLAAAS